MSYLLSPACLLLSPSCDTRRYLTFSALQSEPKDYACNGLAQRLTAASGSTLALGMVVTLASVVYAAFRAGSNTSLFMLDGSEDGEGGAGQVSPGARAARRGRGRGTRR